MLGTNIRNIFKYVYLKNYPPHLQHARFFSSINITITPGMKSLQNLFEKNSFDIRIIGGAVRDILMNKRPKDYDFATTATPDKMKSMFENNGLKVLKRNGEAHGTVAVRMANGEEFEVTTLRRDISTDGRRAKVEFITDWSQDALRRDFTVNAIYAAFDGTLYDYVSGVPDLISRRVRFIGDSDTRIREDYSRSLRYFRFYGKVGPDDFDPEILSAIRNNVAGLNCLSGQRRWTELRKILANSLADDGHYRIGSIITCMRELGIFQYLGLAGCSDDISPFLRVHGHLSRTENPLADDRDHLLLLASLLEDHQQVTRVAEVLKLSSVDRRLLQFVVEHRSYPLSLEAARVLAEWGDDPQEVRSQVAQLLRYQGRPADQVLDFVRKPQSRHTGG